MEKFEIECNRLNDIEFDENDIAQFVEKLEYVVLEYGKPIARFDYYWQAKKFCEENR